MATAHQRQPGECPRLQPSRPFGSSGRIIGAYCRRPDGALRLARRDDLRAFCLTARWPECPRNRTCAQPD
jgi:predicted transcriptional regulator